MKDRIPTYEGRVTLKPVSGAENTYDMERADVPTQEGTPLNKATLLTDATAALLDLGGDATPDDALRATITRLAAVEKAQGETEETLSTATSDITDLKDLITYGTKDLTAGSSALATGHLYVVYE